MLLHEITETILSWIQQQPHVKEESITDWLLFDLSKRCSRIKYYAFTRHEEMCNGADWEWWVLTSHYAYRFRVQAKKLKSINDNYSAVCYSNNNGLQIDLLLDASKQNRAFPLYMFYSDRDQDTAIVLRNYSAPVISAMIKWCDTCRNGAYLSPAQVIYDEVLAKPKRKIDASTLLNISLKLSCFDTKYCDFRSACSEIEEHLNLLDMSFQKKFDYSFKYMYERSSKVLPHRAIPHWLSYITNEAQNHTELPNWFEGEFENQLPNVEGVAVLDLREKQ